MSVAQWMERFGDIDLSAPSRERKESAVNYTNLERVDMQLDVAYPASVVNAKVVASNRGDVQLQVTFALHSDTHGQEPIGKDTEWLTLPYQESDEALAKDTVRKITLRRRDDLVRVLSAVDPVAYSLYKCREGKGADAIYYGHDDGVLSRGELNAREKEINMAVIKYAAELHEKVGTYVDSIKGARLWLVKVANPKNERYPYLNIYPQAPSKVPVFGQPDYMRGGNDSIDF